MKMTDLMPRNKWEELEGEIHDRFGLNARAYDARGFTFTGSTTWCNRLCPVIKSVPSALSAICSVAHQTMAAEVSKTGRSVVSECDLGLVKICVPVIARGELVGVVGGCGRLPESGEIESFLAEKAAGLDPETLQDLAGDLTVITAEEATEVVQFLENRVAQIVQDAFPRA
ncbi:MAG: PocR ligand-binding domain-containing protein [Desulfovibrionales bacterium]